MSNAVWKLQSELFGDEKRWFSLWNPRFKSASINQFVYYWWIFAIMLSVCCFQLLVLVWRPPRGLLGLITFLFRLSKLKAAQKRPSTHNQLISFKKPLQAHSSPPSLIVRGHSLLVLWRSVFHTEENKLNAVRKKRIYWYSPSLMDDKSRLVKK